MRMKKLYLSLIIILCSLRIWGQTYSNIITDYPYIEIEEDEVCIPSEPMETTGKREMLVHLLNGLTLI